MEKQELLNAISVLNSTIITLSNINKTEEVTAVVKKMIEFIDQL